MQIDSWAQEDGSATARERRVFPPAAPETEPHRRGNAQALPALYLGFVAHALRGWGQLLRR
jgi:hypothetical protein